MNAVMENILTRRSTRAFEKKPIPTEELDQILQAAIYGSERNESSDLAVHRRDRHRENSGTRKCDRQGTRTRGIRYVSAVRNRDHNE